MSKALLISTLESFGYPVILQGSLLENVPYPDSFITFFTIDSSEAAAFDNDTAITSWQYQITFYSNDPALVATAAASIRLALKRAGFIPQGKGRDLPSDEPTHTGWTCNYLYLDLEGVLI